MTNKTDEQILAGVPRGATQITQWMPMEVTDTGFVKYRWAQKQEVEVTRSIKDVKELVKLRKENAELESQLMEYASYLNMSLDGTEAHSDVDKRFLNHQAIRDLEQQIKAYARAEYMCPGSIRKKANELRKQAKGGDLVEKDQ